nr:MAG TPA: hypothetical protein [Caudoviricetes sp.]
MKLIINPTVIANRLTPPKTTVQPRIRVNNSKIMPHYLSPSLFSKGTFHLAQKTVEETMRERTPTGQSAKRREIS